jgi:glycine dehydrogenase
VTNLTGSFETEKHNPKYAKEQRKVVKTFLSNIGKGEGHMKRDEFVDRHVGPRAEDVELMLKEMKISSLDELIKKTIPSHIITQRGLKIDSPKTESEALEELRKIANKNQLFKSFIGMGYADCVTPSVIQRNILENPGWYTQYTPYQAEIAQGRLEALLNFQTMIIDLVGLPIANASLLDEATAAAEAMMLCFVATNRDTSKAFFVSASCHPQTISVVQTRAKPLGIKVIVGDHQTFSFTEKIFGALVQYPTTEGAIFDYKKFGDDVHAAGAMFVVAADLMSLALLTPPGEFGADIAVGNSQRFGVPLGYGGPHAAFIACKDEHKRLIPGRIVGVSKDVDGNSAIRLALQTREQHIRRDKATSNICTAQVLLAICASMFAVYHGPRGIYDIAERIHLFTVALSKGLEKLGFKVQFKSFFDTLFVSLDAKTKDAIIKQAKAAHINFRAFEAGVGISLDETIDLNTLDEILSVFSAVKGSKSNSSSELIKSAQSVINLKRQSEYLTHPVFNIYHSETEMLRYMRRLEAKDLSLGHSMIPLGSCTMKLNATSEMVPITWPEFGKLHPFVPKEQAQGYTELTQGLEKMLCELTGFDAVSLQPNAGSQGEYAGLLVIQAYHQSRGQGQRNVCLIPKSAHGTNPASASLAGMKVVVVECDSSGSIDVADLKQKASDHKNDLSSLMVTYPSTHGVFEESITEVCKIVHEHGGQVYMDGANMNAQIGFCKPGEFGPDVCHLNLHKTFCIPHGGGGPGMGPIGVKAHLAPYLPGHPVISTSGAQGIGAVSAAPWGSPSILPISWMYIKMMGNTGLTRATQIAILNANYIAEKLSAHYPVLYKGKNDRVAHECIFDLRGFKDTANLDVEDVAKRLMDYGFHAPTISFPVAGTMMVEPTESESKEELDRFCEAMISIRKEIKEIESGKAAKDNNLLKNAPHTAAQIASSEWNRPYTREQAVYPLRWVRERKFWPSVGRINNVLGDRNLVCACEPIESYQE